MIFENHHEPIIDTQTWERVQELRKQRKRPNRYDEVGLFSGILFCADCGSVMYQQRYQTGQAQAGLLYLRATTRNAPMTVRRTFYPHRPFDCWRTLQSAESDQLCGKA